MTAATSNGAVDESQYQPPQQEAKPKLNPVDVYSAPRLIVPLALGFVLFVIVFNMYSTGASQLAIRQFCLELGKEPTCRDDAALDKAATLSMISLFASGVACIFSVGLFGAAGSRLGRKFLVTMCYFAASVQTLSWTLLFNFPDQVGESWQALVILCGVIYSSFGGVLVLYMGFFGAVGDISAKKPEMRMLLFVCIDIMLGVAGVVGVQTASQLMKHDPRYLTTGCTIGFFTLGVFSLLVTRDTIDPATQQQPIKWSKANVFGQLMFLFPFKQTKKLLNTDFKKVYEKVAEVYNKQLLANGEVPGDSTIMTHVGENDVIFTVTDDSTSSSTTTPGALTPQGLTRNTSSATSMLQVDHDNTFDALGMEIATDGAFGQAPAIDYNELMTANGIKNTLFHESPQMTPQQSPMMSPPNEFLLDGGYGGDEESGNNNNNNNAIFSLNPPPIAAAASTTSSRRAVSSRHSEMRESLLGDAPVSSDQDYSIKQEQSTTTAETKQKTTTPKLKFTEPPRFFNHSNSMLFLVLAVFLYVVQFFGCKVVDLLYIKKVYNATSQDYSNLLTISAVTRGLGSFILVPVLKKFVKTPNQERAVLSGALFGIAAANFLTPFCRNYMEFCLIAVASGLLGTLPSGIVRSLMSNQVTEALQAQVLAAISCAEVFIFSLGGFGFNMVYLKTSSTHPGAVYIICGVVSVLGALCPLVIADSPKDFNLRISMTTQYTKLMVAERKQQQEEKEEKEKQQALLDKQKKQQEDVHNAAGLNSVEYLLDDGAI